MDLIDGDRIQLRMNPDLDRDQLQELFEDAWGTPKPAYDNALERSLVYFSAYEREELVGFALLAWDGGVHAFLIDPTVRTRCRRRGIGTAIVRRLVNEARLRGIEWVHVDYERDLDGFYRGCGFRPPGGAGLIRTAP